MKIQLAWFHFCEKNVRKKYVFVCLFVFFGWLVGWFLVCLQGSSVFKDTQKVKRIWIVKISLFRTVELVLRDKGLVHVHIFLILPKNYVKNMYWGEEEPKPENYWLGNSTPRTAEMDPKGSYSYLGREPWNPWFECTL